MKQAQCTSTLRIALSPGTRSCTCITACVQSPMARHTLLHMHNCVCAIPCDQPLFECLFSPTHTLCYAYRCAKPARLNCRTAPAGSRVCVLGRAAGCLGVTGVFAYLDEQLAVLASQVCLCAVKQVSNVYLVTSGANQHVGVQCSELC